MSALGDVCTITMGQAPDGSTYNGDEIGWPLIAGAGDFSAGRARAKKYTSKPSKLSQPGDVILGIRASIGSKVFSDKEYCLGRGVAGLRGGPDLDQQYLWHWLDVARPTLSNKGRGATFLQVSRQDIAELEIPLPPLPEQRRIATILDQADALRAERRRAFILLDELVLSSFVERFRDVTSNSSGFEMSDFGDLGQLDRGVSRARPRNSPELLGGIHPLIQTGDVANADGYVRRYSQTYSELGLAQSKMWPVGTLAITIAANIAKTGILTFAACFPDSLVGFTPDPSKTNVEFIRFWLSFLQPTLEAEAPASAQRNINLAILRALSVPVPPLPAQEDFAKFVREAQSLKESAEAHVTQLDELFESLQHRAFRGEL